MEKFISSAALVTELASKVVRDEDVATWLADADPAWNPPDNDISEILPSGVITGKLRIPKGKTFGFVGDGVFVTPKSLRGFKDGDTVVVQTVISDRGLVADRIAAYSTYAEWHKEEWEDAVRKLLQRELDESRERARSAWEANLAKASSAGVKLASYSYGYKSSYGGHAIHDWVLEEPVDMSTANALVDAFGRRSMECPEGHTPPVQSVRLEDGGLTVHYEWRGPWCD